MPDIPSLKNNKNFIMRYASTQTKVCCPTGLHVSLGGQAPLPGMTEEKGLGFRFALRMHSVLTDRANSVLVVATVAAPVRTTRTEVEVVGVALIARRTRPVVAVRTDEVELTIPTVARSR